MVGGTLGLQKHWPGWSRGSKEEDIVRGCWKSREGQTLQALLDRLLAFYLKNINKPMKNFKQGSDMIRFVFSSDYLDWSRVRTEAGREGRSFCRHLGRRLCSEIVRLVSSAFSCKYRISGQEWFK